jgi:hypothetical protein
MKEFFNGLYPLAAFADVPLQYKKSVDIDY